jgi:thioesterase domain-containing protein
MNCLAESKHIDIQRLRELSFNGISDEIKGLRPLVWRILLGYLPAEDSDTWEEILREKKKIYEMWKEELIIKPKLSIKDRFSDEAKALEKPKKLTLLDHPLSTQKNSTWNKFYSDKQIWEEIEKDVKRTRVEMAFFMMAVDPERSTAEDMIRLER